MAPIGDPTQLRAKLDLSPKVSAKAANWDSSASAMLWMTRTLAKPRMTGDAAVEKVDLINRYRSSKRCRDPQARAVTDLAMSCLPAPAAWWPQQVAGKPLWSPFASSGIFERIFGQSLPGRDI
eukprot:8660852-Pyramimonas_sp.AAC.1